MDKGRGKRGKIRKHCACLYVVDVVTCHPGPAFRTKALIPLTAWSASFWLRTAESLPRNCPQSKGAASAKGTPIPEAALQLIIGQCRSSMASPIASIQDNSGGSSQLSNFPWDRLRPFWDCMAAQLPTLLRLLPAPFPLALEQIIFASVEHQMK